MAYVFDCLLIAFIFFVSFYFLNRALLSPALVVILKLGLGVYRHISARLLKKWGLHLLFGAERYAYLVVLIKQAFAKVAETYIPTKGERQVLRRASALYFLVYLGIGTAHGGETPSSLRNLSFFLTAFGGTSSASRQSQARCAVGMKWEG